MPKESPSQHRPNQKANEPDKLLEFVSDVALLPPIMRRSKDKSVRVAAALLWSPISIGVYSKLHSYYLAPFGSLPEQPGKVHSVPHYFSGVTSNTVVTGTSIAMTAGTSVYLADLDDTGD